MAVICFFRTTTALSRAWISAFSSASKPLILNTPLGIEKVPLLICLLNFIFFSFAYIIIVKEAGLTVPGSS